MGGPDAPDDLRLGHLTQEWLASSDAPEARTTGGYWHHQRRMEPHPAVHDQRFQDQLLEDLAGSPPHVSPEEAASPCVHQRDATPRSGHVVGARLGQPECLGGRSCFPCEARGSGRVRRRARGRLGPGGA